jgi:hypothetical protein
VVPGADGGRSGGEGVLKALGLAILFLAGALACGEAKPPVPLGAAPGEWYVMGFPRRPITVDGPDGKPVAIDRAIPISVAELRAGTVTVDLAGGARAPVEVAQLYFLPGADGERQLEAWRKSLPWKGYSGGSWHAVSSEGDLYRIELRFRRDDGSEDVHAYFATSDEVRAFEPPEGY